MPHTFRFVGPTQAEAEAGHTHECFHTCLAAERPRHVGGQKNTSTGRLLSRGTAQHVVSFNECQEQEAQNSRAETEARTDAPHSESAN